MQLEVQVALKAKRVHKGMRYLLREVQVCSSGYLRQPGGLWKVLHWYDHPWQSPQVPLITTIFPIKANYWKNQKK